MRSQQLNAPTTVCERNQPRPYSDHFGCSTTRALKPATVLRWLERPLQRSAAIWSKVEPSLERHGLRAEPLPERADERPVLRI